MDTINNDPDKFECYSDHAHDIRTLGACDVCGSTEEHVIGHVMPEVERHTGVDPITAARQVVEHGAQIYDGMLLDHFTAQHVVQVHDQLKPANQAKLKAMPLAQAVDVVWKLVEKFGK